MGNVLYHFQVPLFSLQAPQTVEPEKHLNMLHQWCQVQAEICAGYTNKSL